MLDEVLRTRLEDSARSLARVPVPSLAVLRRRVRRRRVRTGASTLAVSTVIGAVAAAVLPGIPALNRPPAASPTASPAVAGWQPAGPPPAAGAGPSAAAPYLVTIVFQQAPAVAKVEDVLTGKVLATVQPPGGSGSIGFYLAAAAGDDRTFFLSVDFRGIQTRFYELRLGADGTVRSLTKVLTLPVSGTLPSFAVSPDATRLAYTTPRGITVVTLSTGARRSWTAAVSDGVTDLSWAGDRMLAFGWQVYGSVGPRSGVRLLDTAAPGSNLLASRLVVPSGRVLAGGFRGAQDSLIAADGSVVFATVANGSPSNPVAEVVEFSVRTGRPLAVLTPSAAEAGLGTSCMALWSDPSGKQVAAECGSGVDVFERGRYHRTPLRAPTYNYSYARQGFVAW